MDLQSCIKSILISKCVCVCFTDYRYDELDENPFSKWEITTVKLVAEGVYGKYILEEKGVFHWFEEIRDYIDGFEPEYTLIPFKPAFGKRK